MEEQKKTFNEKLKEFSTKHSLLVEIIRFLIIGGIATIIDMLVMGITLYIFQPQNYPNFFNVFYGATNDPSTISTIIGTGLGFIFGLIFNYVFSILFVFEEKGKSKSVVRFISFSLLSFIGLCIHLLGMYIGYDLLKINEWIVKIILTLIVLVYNYLTRKLLIFKKVKEENVDEK